MSLPFGRLIFFGPKEVMHMRENMIEETPWSDTSSTLKDLKEMFQATLSGLKIKCKACGGNYEITVTKEGQQFNNLGIICCLFCGQQIKLY